MATQKIETGLLADDSITADKLANSINTDIATANTTANAALPKAGGTMTGALAMGANTITSIATNNFEIDISGSLAGNIRANSDLYLLSQTGTLNLGAGGTNSQLKILANGNVGIGAPAPSEKLEVDGGIKISNGNSRLYFGTEGGTSYRALEGDTSGTLLQVGENYTDITLQGNVGVGTVSPKHDLSIHNDSGPFISLIGDGYNDEMGIIFNGGDQANVSSAGNTGAKITSQLGVSGGAVLGDLRFTTNSGDAFTDAMRISNVGKVGIGQITPATRLHVKETTDTSAIITIDHSNGGNSYGGFIGSLSGTLKGLFIGHKFNSAFTETARFSGTGRLHINHTNDPGWDGLGTLVVRQKATDAGIGVVDINSQNTFKMLNNETFAELHYNVNLPVVFSAGTGGGTERIRIHTGGNVGINNQAPASTLDVKGALRITRGVDAGHASEGNWNFSISHEDVNHYGTLYMTPSVSTADISLMGNKFRFTSEGFLGINNQHPVVALSLGNASGERMHVYHGGNVRAGFGVDMSGGSRELSMFHSTTGTNGLITFGKRAESNGAYTSTARLDGAGRFALTTANTSLIVGSGITTNSLYSTTTNTGVGIYGEGNYASCGTHYESATDSDTGWSPFYVNKFDWAAGKDARWMAFQVNGGNTDQATLSYDGTNFAIVNTSDYRLKENVVAYTGGLAKINAIGVKSFNKISGVSSHITQEGFLAHELKEVIPLAVIGEKDGMKVDESGETVPNYQTVNRETLIPYLISAIQEQHTIINDLKSRIETLEG